MREFMQGVLFSLLGRITKGQIITDESIIAKRAQEKEFLLFTGIK